MIQVLLVTHGQLAEKLLEISEHILQEKPDAIPVCLDMNSNPDDHSAVLKKSLEEIPENTRLIILTDMFGGTPSNISMPWVKADYVEVITGLNLPMLLYLFSHKDKQDFKELCEGVKNAGKDAILLAGDFLS